MAEPASQSPATETTSDTVISLLNKLPDTALKYVQITILVVCVIMIVGGLIVFYLRAPRLIWRSDYIQVLGTIFFFSTLIILAVYLNMSRDAVVAILGAFLGSIFTRNVGPINPDLPTGTTPSDLTTANNPPPTPAPSGSAADNPPPTPAPSGSAANNPPPTPTPSAANTRAERLRQLVEGAAKLQT
jgi:hypothetical protein